MQILTICLTFVPIFLLIVGVMGVFGIMGMGPMEFPREHPVNRKLAFIILFASLGMFLFLSNTELLSTIGVLFAVGSIFYYTYVVYKFRREFPHQPTSEHYKMVKARYDKRALGWPFYRKKKNEEGQDKTESQVEDKKI